jgi:translation elongation factor EF-1beta
MFLSVLPKIRYYKDVPLCENYVRDFFIAAILPVKCLIRHIARASIVFSLAAILAVMITRDDECSTENYGHANIREIRRVAHLCSI